MRIIHLCSYYIGSQVYKNFFVKISVLKETCVQYVFVPIRKVEHLNLNLVEVPRVHFYYKKCLSLITKISFFIKQISLVLSFKQFSKKSLDCLSADIVHAHTLYSDGFLAFYLKQKYKIPYVLTLRTTDVSVFEKYLLHWRWLTKQVLKQADCVVFLSTQHERVICNKYVNVLKKSFVIPNGVDQFWIDMSIQKKNLPRKRKKKAIYVGEINLNKNVKTAIHAFLGTQKREDSVFVVIGGTYQDFKRVYGTLDPEFLPCVSFLGRIHDKQIIKKHLRDSDLMIMPSFMETFGLVYLEAISQCTPVVYSEGQGFDGVFPDGTVGFKCDPRNIENIKAAVNKTLKMFPDGLDYSMENKNPVVDFSWDKVASKFLAEVY